MQQKNIADLRLDYKQSFLLEEDVKANPLEQFNLWWQQVIAAQIIEPNAMVVSTVDATGMPHNRVVLLKDVTNTGFVFFTNYNSAKGQQIVHNPKVAVCFFWKELERQVRITGSISKISEQDSIAYFNSRPIGSQLGAWASEQSTIINSREFLDNAYANIEDKFIGKPINKPPFWGGYNVVPITMEFWQGRTSRLHDRLLYTLQTNGDWQVERLSP